MSWDGEPPLMMVFPLLGLLWSIFTSILKPVSYTHLKENNFLAAVHFGKASCGVAFLDISTGEFLTAEGPFDYIDKLLSLIHI